MKKQVKIPIACAVIHNFIRMFQHDDRFMTQYFQDGIPVSEIDPQNAEQDVNQNHNPDRATNTATNTASPAQMRLIRDEMASSMWQSQRTNNNQ